MSIRNMKKRDGLIPEQRRMGYPPIRKLIQVGNKKLVLTIHETDYSMTFYIGSRNIYCMDVQIIKKDSGFDRVGAFHKIRYDIECSVNGDFERSRDTNMILRLIITYIYRNYPEVKVLRFNDMSTKVCDNGRPINLGVMTYLWSGQTWYQKNFGAYLESPSDKLFTDREIEFQKRKKTMPWDDMNNIMDTELPMPEEDIKELYIRSNTWQTFFKGIVDVIGIPKFCNFISTWIYQFLLINGNVISDNMQFALPVKDYGIEYTVADYTGGKRKMRRTRKL